LFADSIFSCSFDRPRMSDPFDILGLPAAFALDGAEIDRAYLARSAALHPDLAAGDAEAPRKMAALNQAKRALEDPERRANVLLARLGGPAKEADRSLPPGFLMDMMETREAIEAAVRSGDPSQRRQWEGWAEDRRREAIMEVGSMFGGLGTPPAAEGLRAIRTRLNAWRYIERLIEQLDPDYDPARADFGDAGQGGR
jgi:molecular chaperone HscB